MSYIHQSGNWKYCESVRFNRMLYSTISCHLAIVDGLTGHELRVETAKEFKKRSN